MKDQRKNPNPENPEQLENIKLDKPKKYAAGWPAISSSVKHVLDEMDFRRGLKVLNKVNKMDGFDCPGCAWPDPDDERSILGEYCENGAKAIAEEATTKAIWADFLKKHSVSELSELDDYRLGKMGRLCEPMYLPKGGTHYEPISWDGAFEKIAEHLNNLESPDEAIFYTSGRTSNEAAFLYQLFVRQFGTNNLPDCSNMCHESSGVALVESLGIGKGSVTLEDFYESELIIILGQNPGTNHPRMLSALKKARKNNAMILTINPLREAGLEAFADPQTLPGLMHQKNDLTTDYLPVRINGDMALLQAINHVLLELEDQEHGKVFDYEFVKNQTHGFDTYIEHLRALNLDELSQKCGISVEQIKTIANKIKYKKKIIACWAMGLTQHKNSVDTIKEVVNLLLLKGSIGKPGAGTCPVRGHSNVQGDRTMGIYERPWKWLLDNLAENYSFEPPRHDGFDVVDCIKAMYKKNAKVFVAMGGNFLSATPDTLYTAEALNNCDLTVQISTKLNRSHLITGKEAIILPTLGRSDKDFQNGVEQFISCENSMGVVQKSRGVIEPVSNRLRSEVSIVCNLANTVLGNKSRVPWSSFVNNYDLIRDEIERTIPGFDNYNERVRQDGGFYLPNSARANTYLTMTSKANFNVASVDMYALKDDELMMMTIRSHDQYNTTIYGLDDRYRGIKNERRVILMNQDDMNRRDLKKMDLVDLFNYHDNVERVARKFLVIPYEIPQNCCATYFPETNVLVPITSVAKKSNTPTSKSVVIKVERSKKK